MTSENTQTEIPRFSRNTTKHKTPVQNLYSIYDSVSGIYWAPFLAENDDVAQRTCRQMASDERSIVSKSIDDYSLFFLGDFDPDDGLIGTPPKPELISKFNEL